MQGKTALISFLGKSRINQDGLYREATYQLATGEDVTHGLRHLPMVAFAAAQLMQQLHRKTIGGLHYGALAQTQGGITPVLAIDGLMLIDRWVKALHTFDKDGDYGVFVPLLEGLAEPVAIEHLKKAAFLERINNVRQARGQLHGFLKHLENKAFVQPIEKLFMPALKERISWALAGRLGERQIQLAGHYLGNSDYIRAVLLAWEALITHETATAGRNPETYSDRDQTNSLLKEDPDLKKQYRVLRNLRNALAHGESSSLKEVQQLVDSEERLRDYLQEFLAELSTHICG